MPDNINLSGGNNIDVPGASTLVNTNTLMPSAPVLDFSTSDENKIEIANRNTPEQVETTAESEIKPFFNLKELINGVKDNKVAGSDLTPVNYELAKDGGKFNKYGLGYYVDQDNEDIYANNLPWYQHGLVTFVPKLLGYTISKVGQTVGNLAGLLNPVNLYKEFTDSNFELLEEASNNGFAKVFNRLEDTIRNDLFPTYQEIEDRNKGFFGRMFTDGDFWSEDFVDGAAFMLSAFVPGLAVTKLGLGAKLVGGLSRFSKLLGASENAVLGASKWGAKVANYLKQAEKIKKTVDKTSITALNTVSESFFEAKNVRDNVIDQLSQARLNGENNYTDEEIRKKAGEASYTTFLANVAALSVSNYWSTNIMYKMLGKTANDGSKILGRGIKAKGLFGKGFEFISRNSKIGKLIDNKFGNFGIKFLEGIGVEGFYEENIQLAISRYAEKTGKYDNFIGQWIGQTVDAIKGDDKEAAMNIGLGGLMGSMFSAGSSLVKGEYANTKAMSEKILKGINDAELNLLTVGDIYVKDDQGKTVFEAGKPKIDLPKLMAYQMATGNIQGVVAAAQTADDNVASNIIANQTKKQALAAWAVSMHNAGLTDQIGTRLDEMKGMSVEELAMMGIAVPNKQAINEAVEEHKQFAKSVVDLYDTIENDILINPVDKKSGGVQSSRKNHLLFSGALQISLEQELDKNKRELEDVRNKMKARGTNPTDTLVDSYNDLTRRIDAQQKLIDSIDTYVQDGSDIDKAQEEKNLEDLKTTRSELVSDNQEDFDKLSKEGEFLQYENEEVSKSALAKKSERIAKLVAELENSIKSANQEWYKSADLRNGFKYYKEKYYDKQEDSLTKQIQEALESENQNLPKNSVVVKTTNSKNEPIDQELVEGDTYIGKLHITPRFTAAGVQVSEFNNDTFHILQIDGDNITMSINGDAAVTFHISEFSEIGKLTNIKNLTPVQALYLKHRNKAFSYRVPAEKDKNGRWTTKIVRARLALNKEKDTLMVVYEKNKRIPFNVKFLISGSGVDVSTFNDAEQALLEKQEKLQKEKLENQIQYLNNLITQTEAKINEEKVNTEAVENEMADLEGKIADIKKQLQSIYDDKSNKDARTKDGFKKKVRGLITTLTNELAQAEGLLETLKAQRETIQNRLNVLEAQNDLFYTYYDEIETTQTPIDVGVGEQTRLQDRITQLQKEDNRNPEDRLVSILNDTQAELSLTNDRISYLENYINEIKDILSKLNITERFLNLFTDSRSNIQTVRQTLRNVISTTQDMISQTDDIDKLTLLSDQLKEARLLMSMVVKENPDAVDNYKAINEVRKDLEKSANELAKLNTALQALKEKEARLLDALNIKDEITGTANRLNAIKDLYSAFMTEYETAKVKSGVFGTNKTKDPNTEYRKAQQLTDSTGQVIAADSTTPRPVLEETGLFKIADRHFNQSAEGDVLVEEPYKQRFFKFTSDNNISSDLFLQVVTFKNDAYGIRYENEAEGYGKDVDIKVIVVKKVGNEYKPVGVNGEVLTTPTKDNIIYTSIHGAQALLSGTKEQKINWVKNNYTVGNLSDAKIEEHINNFIQFRNEIINASTPESPVILKIKNKSNGIENKEAPRLGGQYPQLGVEGRLVPKNIEDEDWKSLDVRVVTQATTNANGNNVAIINGVSVASGRLVFIDKENGNVFRLYNRKFTESEVENIANSIIKFNQLLGRKQDLKGEELTDFNRLLSYLNSTLYWSVPEEGEEISNKQVWISNGLHIGANVFIPSVNMNVNTISAAIRDMYHQVNNKNFQEKNNNNMFFEPVFANGAMTWKPWNSYKQYLLQSKDGRKSPVYTNVITKSNDITKPQLKNVYLTYHPISGENTKATTPVAATVNPSADKVNGMTLVNITGDNSELQYQGTDTTVGGLKNGSYKFMVVSETNNKYMFGITKNGNTMTVVKSAVMSPTGENISATMQPQLEVMGRLFTTLEPTAQLSAVMQEFFERTKAVGLFLVEMVDPAPQVTGGITTPAPAVSAETTPSSPTPNQPEVQENNQVVTSDELQAKLNAINQIMGNATPDDNVTHRLALSQNPEVKEDIAAFKKWIAARLPQFPVEIVDRLIGGKAWGEFKNNAILVYSGSGQGTGYHEAFEAVWNALLNENEKFELIREFQNRSGEFTNIFTGETKNYSDANEYDVREMLAEEFIGYVNNDGRGIERGRPKKNTFFKRLWNFLKSLLGMSTENEQLFDSKITELFSKINKGEFKNTVPTSFTGNVHRAIPGTNQLLTSQIIEGVHSLFFRKLFENNENMDSLLNKATDAQFVSDIFAQTKQELTNFLFAPIRAGYMRIQKGETVPANYEQSLDLTTQTFTEVLDKFYSDIVPIYKDYLKRFGIVFKESIKEDDKVNEQEIQEKEQEVKDSLGIKEAIYVDSRNLASSAIRLLVASLGALDYKAGGTPSQMVNRKNGLGLPMLVDYGKTLNVLLNELEGTVPVYRNGIYTDRIDLMFEKLDRKYKVGDRYKPDFLWIAQLKNRIKYETFTGEKYDVNTLNDSERRLLVAFEKSFANTRNLPIKLIVNAEGIIYSTDPIVTANINRIREEWLNNAKALSNGAGTLLSIDNQTQIILNVSKITDLLNTNKFEDKLELLKQLGINLNVPSEELETKGGLYYDMFNKAIGSIRYVISNNKVKTFDDLFGRQIANGPINSLIAIEMTSKSQDISLQYQNAAGKSEYSITLPSLVSNLVNSFKSVDNLADFVRTNPQLGTVQGNEVILNSYQGNSLILQPGGVFFDKNGMKRPNANIQYQLFSGMSNAMENDGYVTADLQYPDKVAQELFHILNGTYFTIINSDKSSEFGLKLGHFINFNESNINSEVITRLYLPHLKDEVLAAIDNTVSKSNIQYYKDGVEKLGHFRTILDSSKDKFQQVLTKKLGVDDFINSKEVYADIERYLNRFIEKQKNALLDSGIIEKNSNGNYLSNYLPKEVLNDYGIDNTNITEGQLENLLRFMFINHQTAVREQHKLIYGHPALYKDLAKRTSGANSTKEAIVSNTKVIAAMDRHMPRTDGKIRGAKEEQTFNVISYKDNIVMSRYTQEYAQGIYQSMVQAMDKAKAEKLVGATFNEDGSFKDYIMDGGRFTGIVAAYAELNEADAQAWIMPDYYRDLLYLSGKWSDLQEEQWQYEMAYERRALNKMVEGDKEILAKGSPGAILPTLKPQFFGYQENDVMMHTTFLKNSVQPKFYRHVEGTAFADIYLKAKQSQIDIIGFESGEKVGNVVESNGDFQSMYDNGSISEKFPTIQSLYQRYFGIQVEMAAKSKSSVVRGTQMTKLIMSNLINNGVAVNEQVMKVIEDYNNTLSELMRLGKDQLMKEIGLQTDTNGEYFSENLDNLIKILREEAIKRDLPDNILESLEVDPENPTRLKYKFDTLPIREKIDNILNSIVDSRVISQKTTGFAAVQVAPSGYENSSRWFAYLEDGVYKTVKGSELNTLTEEQRKNAKMTSSDLKFYRLENGKISAMEVYLPSYLKGIVGEDIKNIDPRLLRLIGFRIPTQALSQIESIVVKGFLPEEQGDMIVVPSEIVGKSGSDFDIDKMNLYLPNYFMNRYGKPQYIDPNLSDSELDAMAREVFAVKQKSSVEAIKLMDDIFDTQDEIEDFVVEFKKKALENKLINLSIDLISMKENFRQLMMPNSASTLKELEGVVMGLKNQSKEATSPTDLMEWNSMSRTRERYLTGKQLVGIGAVQITSHTIGQIANVKLTGMYTDARGNRNPIELVLSHNLDENGKLTLASVTSKDGMWISELLSEAMTGFVDAAKDPFVFNLNINMKTASTYFYLLKLGVPIEEAVLFHTQPILESYIQNLGKNESVVNDINGSKAYNTVIRTRTSLPYYKVLGLGNKTPKVAAKAAKDLADNYRMENPTLSIAKMKSAIANLNNPTHTPTREEAILQLVVLEEFLKYEDQARSMGNFNRAISYDTRRTKNIIENDLQKADWNKMLNDDFIENAEHVLDGLFLQEAKTQKEDIPAMFKEHFAILNPKLLPVRNKIMNFLENEGDRLGAEDKSKILNKYQNFVLSYLINTTTINANEVDFRFGQYYHLFRDGEDGRVSLAKELINVKKKYPSNQALQELYPIISGNRNGTDNIKLYGTKLSSFEINVITESLINLMDEAVARADNDTVNFINKLVIFSSLQSGVQQSPISYTRILPVQFYSNLVSKVFEKFENENVEIDENLIWKQFHQNFFYDTVLNPVANKEAMDESGDMIVSPNSPLARYEYLSTRKLKAGYTRQELNEMIKNKQWNDLLVNKLYQRVYETEDRIVYKEINKLGNKMFMIETYKTDTKDMLESELVNAQLNGFVIEDNFKGLLPNPMDNGENSVSLQDNITLDVNDLSNLANEIIRIKKQKEDDSKNCNQ